MSKPSKWSKFDQVIINRFNNSESFNAAQLAKDLLGGADYKNKDFLTLRVYIWRVIKRSKPSSDVLESKLKWEQNESAGTAQLEQGVSKPVKSLSDLVKVCNIDLNKWQIDRWVCNTWGVTSFNKSPEGTYRTNYQVKAWLSKREKTTGEVMKELLPLINDYTPKKIKKNSGSKIGVASFADFHFGAKVKDLLRTRDFNLGVLIGYLHRAADEINKHEFKEVHINLLGDFFESLSGINHENTFKSLDEDGWGGNIIILTNEVLAEHLLGRINNLTSINMVSGNHDRMTASNKVDNTGEGGKILWYMLKKDFPNIPVRYHNSVLSVEIDNINYLLTHGDKGYSKKEFSKFVLDYGNQKMYNLVMEGHLHSRIYSKAVKSNKTEYDDIEMVTMDDVGYRKIICPSIFTGNWYSESLGYSSAAGMIITYNNGKGQPNVLDICL